VLQKSLDKQGAIENKKRESIMVVSRELRIRGIWGRGYKSARALRSKRKGQCQYQMEGSDGISAGVQACALPDL
jgi:hypothetical protein